MAFTCMRLTQDAGIARLTFTQGDRGNPIGGDFCRELLEVADALSTDSTVRAVLIEAEGKAFSYGGDIKEFADKLDRLPTVISRSLCDLNMAIIRLQRMDAPMVVAINGACAGAMAGIVAGADVIVAGPEALFLAAYPTIGYSPDGGTSVMYTRRMGVGRARRFLLMNERLDAAGALAAGLVDEVAGAEAFAARAEEIAAAFASGPTKAYGETRRLMDSVGNTSLEAQLELEAAALTRLAGLADAREGLTAFLEKRAPRFTGK